MNEKIRQHLAAYAQKNNWSTDNDALIEILTESDDVFRKKVGDSRWWYTEFIVTEVDGMLIGYEYASANRDESVRDLGWEFDQSTICEVKAVEKTVIVYEPVKNTAKGAASNTMHTDPAAKSPEQEQATVETQESASLDQAMEVDAEEGTEG